MPADADRRPLRPILLLPHPPPCCTDRAKWLGPFSEGAVPSYLKGEAGWGPYNWLAARRSLQQPTRIASRSHLVLRAHLVSQASTLAITAGTRPACPLTPRRLRGTARSS